jgi:predicted GTPase
MATDRARTASRRIVILGAAGRDFHDFNVVYRDDPTVEVVAFTATQIPDIDDRRYPPSLSGPHHPSGIPIVAEQELETLCQDRDVDEVVFAYSDVPHAHVMHLAARALACGCDFSLLGPARTSLRSSLPVIAVSAVRTGCGKSQTARWIAGRLRERGKRPAVLRHPMPYGDLAAQAVQRFASREDLERADCTIEEREEYEPYVDAGGVIFAGVDYAAILESAEAEADMILWDGGNNDWPFVVPDLHIVLIDALRPDQVTTHHPGEVVARQADVLVVNKISAAAGSDVQRAIDLARAVNPDARILRADSPVVLDDPEAVRDRRVLVVDDGPTLTHGGMGYGAGFVAAVAAGAKEIIDPRPFAVPEIQRVFDRFPHLGRVLPAMGYSPAQRDALRKTIEASGADCVVAGTPIDLSAELGLRIRVVRARYGYSDAETPGLGELIDAFAKHHSSD